MLSLHPLKPRRLHGRWVNETGHDIHILDTDFPEGANLQWTDEPLEVEILINKNI